VIRETVEAGLLDESNCIEAYMRLSMPIVILEDNKSAINWSNKSSSTQRMRHVERSLDQDIGSYWDEAVNRLSIQVTISADSELDMITYDFEGS
jgi:hypothetical protein